MRYLFYILSICICNMACAQNNVSKSTSLTQNILKKYPHIDLNKNGKIEASEAENITELDLMGMNITDVDDIVIFKNLHSLSLTSNKLEKFKVSNLEHLEQLYVANNNLKEFEVSNMPALKDIACGRNQLQEVKIKDCPNIESLNVMDNQLKKIHLMSFKKLKYLTADGNQLKEVNLSANSELIQVAVNDNNIKTIDITRNPKLQMHILYIDANVTITGTEKQLKEYRPAPSFTVED